MARPSSLVSTEWLQQQLDVDAPVVAVEVSRDPAPSAAAGAQHVPGARFVFWKDLLWSRTDRQFPSPEDLALRLSVLGVADEHTIALVGDPFQYAAYAYWVLTMAGQESRTVLVDGGRPKWLADGHPLGAASGEPTEGNLTPGEPDESCRIGRREVLERLGDPSVRLLDVRSPEEYNGQRVSPSWFEIDYGAERAGRIPGAVHCYYGDLLREDGTFRDRAQLAAALEDQSTDATETVTYCRLSHRASLAWFALTRILETPAVRVYDGSWTEWGSIVGYPIEREES